MEALPLLGFTDSSLSGSGISVTVHQEPSKSHRDNNGVGIGAGGRKHDAPIALHVDHLMAARLSQINYDREMALILTEPGLPGKTEIYGVAGLSADPNNERAEYALIVRGDMSGMGLGTLLLRRILAYAKARGIREVYGKVLRENRRMLRLCDELGFRTTPDPDDFSVTMTSIALQ